MVGWRAGERQPTTTTGQHTTCCNLQSYAPDDGQKFVRIHVELILEINKYCYLLHLVGFAVLHCLYNAACGMRHCKGEKLQWYTSP
jgi:hypothetical protein